MAINVTSRIRNAMVMLTVVLCALFTGLIFLLVYVIEDQVFVNQVKLAQAQFTKIAEEGDPVLIQNWQPSNPTMQRVFSAEDLPTTLSLKLKAQIIDHAGVHEYFDDDNALFISRIESLPDIEIQTGFIVYDVGDLLAVRGSKLSLFLLISLVSLIITLAAMLFARRLTQATLAPVVKLSSALKENDLDEVIIEMAKEFSNDEISVLTRELANSMEAMQETAKREFEFNRGISHELRSPIQVAQSAVELLELTSTENKASAKVVSRLQRSVGEMNEITEAFLWLSSQRILEKSEYVSVAQIKSLVELLHANAPTDEIQLCTTLANEQRLPIPKNVVAVVIRNLVKNAISHGQDKTVLINLNKDEIRVTNSVNPAAKQSPSFGVGLPIVGGLLERFDCQIKSEINDTQYKAIVLLPCECA